MKPAKDIETIEQRGSKVNSGHVHRICNTFLCLLKKHRHCLLALYLPVYLLAFWVLEQNITQNYWASYVPADDAIPFVAEFVIPYCMWYPYAIFPGLYLMVCDVPVFKKFMYHIMIGMTLGLVICAIFPNGQDLRPLTFKESNFCTQMVGEIYRVDTNTNVLPSMHVIGTLAVFFGIYHSAGVGKYVKAAMAVIALLICASTVLIKQHSILDVIAALFVSLPTYVLVYHSKARHIYSKNTVVQENK